MRSESLLRLESGILRVNLINGIKPCARAAVTELGANFCPIKLAGPIGDTRKSNQCGLQLWARPLEWDHTLWAHWEVNVKARPCCRAQHLKRHALFSQLLFLKDQDKTYHFTYVCSSCLLVLLFSRWLRSRVNVSDWHSQSLLRIFRPRFHCRWRGPPLPAFQAPLDDTHEATDNAIDQKGDADNEQGVDNKHKDQICIKVEAEICHVFL